MRRAHLCSLLSIGFALAVLLCACTRRPAPPESIVQEMQRQARALLPEVRAPWVREFLLATAGLPPIPRRTLYSDSPPRTEGARFFSEPQAAQLQAPDRARLRRIDIDEEYYYYWRTGTPLAYARPLDLVAASGVGSIAGKRVLDFGYGPIGAPRLLASLGADVTGVDVNPETFAAYGFPGDQGMVPRAPGSPGEHPQGSSSDSPPGRLRLVLGRFPADPAVREAVGRGYDLILSKNTLKNGYLHPERPVDDPRKLIRLGVSDEDFVRALATILKPGGRIIIYNLYPAQSTPDKPFIPWADGRCPFPERLFVAAGLRVLPPGLDIDDTPFARRMGRLLGWDRPDPRHPEEPPMDLNHDLFASYTIIEKDSEKSSGQPR